MTEQPIPEVEAEGKSRLWLWILLGVSPILYVLSIGPVAYVEQVTGLGGHGFIAKSLEIIYYPLIQAMMVDFEGVGGLLSAYIIWWIELAQ